MGSVFGKGGGGGGGYCGPGPLRGENDAGRSARAILWDVAATALAILNTVTAARMAAKQMDLAKRYLSIAQGWHSWYNSNFVPLEDQELDEAMNLPKAVPYFDAAVGRARASARFALRGRVQTRIRTTSQYATGLRGARLKEELIGQALALTMAEALGRRNEQARVDALDDRRWKRREQVVNRGRNLMADNVRFGQLAMGIYGDLGRQAAEGAAGAMTWLGYSSARQNTVYGLHPAWADREYRNTTAAPVANPLPTYGEMENQRPAPGQLPTYGEAARSLTPAYDSAMPQSRVGRGWRRRNENLAPSIPPYDDFNFRST